MKPARILIVAGFALTAWGALAKQAPAPAAPTPTSIVAARQAGMATGAVSFNSLRAAAAGGTAPRDLAFAAGALAKWADAMPALFAPSTRSVASRTKPEVWSDGAGFAARAAAFASATKALAAAAKADDKAAFTAALASTGAACKGCHDSFQAPPPAAKPG